MTIKKLRFLHLVNCIPIVFFIILIFDEQSIYYLAFAKTIMKKILKSFQ